MLDMTSAEHHRPAFHFTPPSGWSNDPNGLLYFDGEYHLFYQYHPDSLVWGPMHWGHAVSTDLIAWEHLPIALYPDHRGTIFSGSAVADTENTSGLVPGGGLVAVFSYHTQAQGIAYSTDRGRTWTKYAGNPVIPSPGGDFRDPKVFWYAPASCWMMVIVRGDHAEFYRSSNLIDWTLISMFGAAYGSHGGVWECPDLFPMQIDGETKWVLIISVGKGAPAGGSGTQYFIGQFDGMTFTSDNPPEVTLWLDYGPDNYAGVTYNDTPDGRRMFIGWMNNWSYADTIPATLWRGSMTVPRELSIRHHPEQGIRLVQMPVAELAAHRTMLFSQRDLTVDSLQSHLTDLPQALDIEVEFDVETASSFGIVLAHSADQRTTVTVDPRQQTLTLDRRDSGKTTFHEAFSGQHVAPLAINSGNIRLRLLLDVTSVELFAGDGVTVLTSQIFPDPDTLAIKFFANGGTVKIVNLDVYSLT